MPHAQFANRADRSTRRGITLIELLVVMVIISIVTAATIPLLSTGSEARRVREAARLVSGYISAAKSRAIETGRPAGVMFQRFQGQSFAMTLVGVEVPPPYAGDTTNSTATINSSNQLSGFSAGDSSWLQLVRVGDLIRLGYQGRTYMMLGTATAPGSLSVTGGQLLSATGFTGTTSGTPCNLWATDGSLALPAQTTATITLPGPPPTTTLLGVPYQIFRQPVKSGVQPLQLPEETVVDLMESGVGTMGQFSQNGSLPYQNPIITFGPTGAVSFAYYDNNPPQHMQSTLYLLIGRRDSMEDLGVPGTNISHHSSMWVAVGPESGIVVTAENMTGALNAARTYAQQASSIGGR